MNTVGPYHPRYLTHFSGIIGRSGSPFAPITVCPVSPANLILPIKWIDPRSTRGILNYIQVKRVIRPPGGEGFFFFSPAHLVTVRVKYTLCFGSMLVRVWHDGPMGSTNGVMLSLGESDHSIWLTPHELRRHTLVKTTVFHALFLD